MKKTLSLFITTVILTIIKINAQEYNQHLVAYYPFNNSLQDFSGYSGQAIAENFDFVEDRNGKPRSSAYFTGLGRLEIIDAPQLKLFKDFTISFWINPEKNSTMNLFSRTKYETADNAYYGMAYNLNPYQGISLWVNDTKDCRFNSDWTKFSDTQNRTNIWTHITSVVSDGFAKLYINGVLSKEAVLKTDSITNCGLSNFIFGANWANDSRNFTGKMDDIKIFKKGLSSSEVNDMYLNSDLVAYYPLVNNAQDLSGYNNNGKLTSPEYVYDDCLDKNVLSFNGTSSKLILADAPQINLFKKFTISMKVKPRTESVMNIFSRTLYPSADNTYYGIAYALENFNTNGNGQEFRYYHNDINSCRYNSSFSQIASNNNKANQWYNLTIVYDEIFATFYNNGRLIEKRLLNKTFINNCGESDFIIGANWVNDPRYFFGYMSDIKIYERNLTAAEVEKLVDKCKIVTAENETSNNLKDLELIFNGNNVEGIKNTNKSKIKCTIYDLQGNLILKQEQTSDIVFSNLKSGIYLINIENGDKVQKFKIIK